VTEPSEPQRSHHGQEQPPRRRSSIIDVGKALGQAILDKGSTRLSYLFICLYFLPELLIPAIFDPCIFAPDFATTDK
jgi:hypothetical protein